jgi:membrane protease YdiL (CAAX protease family)
MINTITPSGSPYHRLLRSDPRHRWWRPLLVGLVATGLYLAILVVILVVVVAVGLVVPSVELAVDRSWQGDLDLGDPVAFALLLGLLILLLPALLLATRLTGSRPAGVLSSVTGRLRFRWLGTAMLVAFAVWAPVMAVWVALEAATGTLVVRQVAPASSVALLVLTVALVPFQAAAEEYVFRGYLAQLVGSWLRHPAFAVLLPVPLFVLGHGYDALGAVDVGVFAVFCGWLVWRTGGLEAGIAAHVANNVVLMSLNALGLGDPNATDTTVLGLVVSIAMMAVFTVLVTRRAGSLGIARSRPAASSAGPALTTSARPDDRLPATDVPEPNPLVTMKG